MLTAHPPSRLILLLPHSCSGIPESIIKMLYRLMKKQSFCEATKNRVWKQDQENERGNTWFSERQTFLWAASFFLSANTIRCFATSTARAFGACSMGSTLLNALCVVSSGGFRRAKKAKKNETQQENSEQFYYMLSGLQLEAEVTLQWKVLSSVLKIHWVKGLWEVFERQRGKRAQIQKICHKVQCSWH